MPLYEYLGTRPTVGRDVFIAPNATVIGNVTLGDEASVWFGATLRGDVYPIRLGARTNLQDGCVVHVTGEKAATTIGDDVTVGHMVLLHGCTVGDRTLVGMGSTLLDECVIGEECIIGAGSLVPPRAVIPPRSLALGRPARVIRKLTDADLAWVLEARTLYIEYARNYRTGGVKLIE
jgi:carbonic anhydrase/acetyltransferase-like protein (isoleucine patch superfamily)